MPEQGLQAGSNDWLMLTPSGALQAFSQPEPDAAAVVLQWLLSGTEAVSYRAWLARHPQHDALLRLALESGWIQRLQQPMQGPQGRLDDFLQHVVGSLSDVRQATLASEGGFCLSRSGMQTEEAELLCAAAADYFDFARRQARRGLDIRQHFMTLHREPHLLLTSHTFVPLWVDGVGYWLVLIGEPLLNNPALVELLWGIRLAGTRFGEN